MLCFEHEAGSDDGSLATRWAANNNRALLNYVSSVVVWRIWKVQTSW